MLSNARRSLIAAVLMQHDRDDPAGCIAFEGELGIYDLVEELVFRTRIDRGRGLRRQLCRELVTTPGDIQNGSGLKLVLPT